MGRSDAKASSESCSFYNKDGLSIFAMDSTFDNIDGSTNSKEAQVNTNSFRNRPSIRKIPRSYRRSF